LRRKKTLLTSIEKRKLGLQKLPKKGLKYQSFSALHHLWAEYIENFLDLNTRYLIVFIKLFVLRVIFICCRVNSSSYETFNPDLSKIHLQFYFTGE